MVLIQRASPRLALMVCLVFTDMSLFRQKFTRLHDHFPWFPFLHNAIFLLLPDELHSFVEIDHEIFSTVILSLPLIQGGQLSVSGERMCTILVNRLED